ncbi:PepSY domain-containing protein [Candidatus Woesearchaeota archaeon]|nr:PepSY domain-containing protein [Candidatus Woesearchaeota archaeon]
MKELIASLRRDSLFQSWQQQHPEAYCTHLFCQITSDGTSQSPWEMGFYDHASGKITVFAKLLQGFEIKPADDVFRKDAGPIEKLDVDKVKISVDQATARCRELIPQKFPQEKVGNGFLILQTLNGVTVWNFSFITQSLKFVNVKIDARSGEEESSQSIDLVEKKK